MWKEFSEALNDDRRGKVIFTIIACVISGIVLLSCFFYSFLTSEGCKASVSTGDLVSMGMLTLLVTAFLVSCLGAVFYGGAHLPEIISDYFEYRRDPERRAREARYREEFIKRNGTRSERMSFWFKDNYKIILRVFFILGLIILVSYSLSYMFWMIYC